MDSERPNVVSGLVGKRAERSGDLEHGRLKLTGFADQGLCPLLPSLGPMALRSQAHAGVPPLSLALRGGSLLYLACRALNFAYRNR
jgi:hypothetical protein